MRWCVALLIFVAACETPPELPPPDAAVPDAAPPRVDLLFLVDNTVGFETGQQNIATGLSLVINILTSAPQRPDMHIAVVTSDMGAGAFTSQVPTCMQPDRGSFVSQPRHPFDPTGCQTNRLTGPERFFIDGDNGHFRNYQGDLAIAFGCLIEAGTTGCQFQHQLSAVRAALGDPQMGLSPPAENAGFLRDDAVLAILLLTHRDDCSAPPDSQLFDPNNLSLGALTPFRCTEYGILCNGQPPPTTDSGPLTNCTSNDARAATDPTQSLIPTQFFIDYFRRINPNVVLYAWAGPPNPFSITVDPQTSEPRLTPSCTSSNGAAFAPSVRIQTVLDAFGARAKLRAGCAGSRGDALGEFTNMIVANLH